MLIFRLFWGVVLKPLLQVFTERNLSSFLIRTLFYLITRCVDKTGIITVGKHCPVPQSGMLLFCVFLHLTNIFQYLSQDSCTVPGVSNCIWGTGFIW